jgi:hypothetical protein
MAIGADVATAKPAPVGTIRGGTKVQVGIDGASASPGAGGQRWGRTGGLGVFLSLQFTGFAHRFMDQPGKRLGFFGTSASRWMGRRRRRWHTG